MNTELKRIEAEALKLSVEDREYLLERLLCSLDGAAVANGQRHGFATAELERYWVDESHRRMKLIESGEMETYPADEVIAQLRAELGR